jgi:hypothetical protein
MTLDQKNPSDPFNPVSWKEHMEELRLRELERIEKEKHDAVEKLRIEAEERERKEKEETAQSLKRIAQMEREKQKLVKVLQEKKEQEMKRKIQMEHEMKMKEEEAKKAIEEEERRLREEIERREAEAAAERQRLEAEREKAEAAKRKLEEEEKRLSGGIAIQVTNATKFSCTLQIPSGPLRLQGKTTVQQLCQQLRDSIPGKDPNSQFGLLHRALSKKNKPEVWLSMDKPLSQYTIANNVISFFLLLKDNSLYLLLLFRMFWNSRRDFRQFFSALKRKNLCQSHWT